MAPDRYRLHLGPRAASTVTILVLIYWAVVVIPLLLYNTVRQLALVTRIHRIGPHRPDHLHQPDLVPGGSTTDGE